MTTAPRTISTADIIVGDRHRKDFGDLEGLAESIQAEGLLQPIGITADNQLVFGERRLRAVRDVLGWDRIECRVVDVSSIVAGEPAEMRKDFTLMERVAIGRALEEEIGERRGGDRSKTDPTRNIVAKAIGFGSGEQYARAKKVDTHGSAALKEAVDRGELDVTTAAKLAELPKSRQTEVVKAGRAEAKRVTKNGDVPKPTPRVAHKYPVVGMK